MYTESMECDNPIGRPRRSPWRNKVLLADQESFKNNSTTLALNSAIGDINDIHVGLLSAVSL